MNTPRFFVEYGGRAGSGIVLMGVVVTREESGTKTKPRDPDLFPLGSEPDFLVRGISWAFRNGVPDESRVSGHLSGVGTIHQSELRVYPGINQFGVERTSDGGSWRHGDFHQVYLGTPDLCKPSDYLSDRQREEVLSILQRDDNLDVTHVLLEGESWV